MLCYSAGWQKASKYSKVQVYVVKAISLIDNARIEFAGKDPVQANELFKKARNIELRQVKEGVPLPSA